MKNPAPTIYCRFLRCVGQLPVPHIRGLLSRVGVLKRHENSEFVVPFFGLKYRGHLGQLIDRQIYLFGSYAPGELAFLGKAAAVLRQRGETLTFMDVGANVGQHSLFMAMHADRVLAFEPNPAAADQLVANVDLNKLDNIQLFRFALGSTETTAPLGSGFEGNNGSRSLTWTLDCAKDINVQVRRGDDVLEQIGASKVGLMKIDVEGYEREVFCGLRQTLQHDRPVILFELISDESKEFLRSETNIQSIIYENVSLFTLSDGSEGALRPVDWRCNDFVAIPRELVPLFSIEKASGGVARQNSTKRESLNNE